MTTTMTTTNNYDPSGQWRGAGMEMYHELNTNKFYKIKFNVIMTITKVDKNIYRVKSSFRYKNSGDIMGFRYTKNEISSTEDNLVHKDDNVLLSSSLWLDSDSLSRTLDRYRLSEDGKHLDYSYNVNNVYNPLIPKFLKSLYSVFNKKAGRISVAGNFKLQKI
jgi:hypothetical protein